MRIICPTCASHYEVDAGKIGLEGRQVRCAECRDVWLVRALDGSRAAARRLGDALVADGTLADPEDIFFLTLNELDRLDARAPSPDLRAAVAERRGRHDGYAQTRLPDGWWGDPEPLAASLDDLIAPATDPPDVVREFDATLCWFAEPAVTAGRRFRLKHTTRLTPASRIAPVQGGVWPWWQQGSSVT